MNIFFLDENFYSKFKLLSVEQIGKIVKKLVLKDDFEKYDNNILTPVEKEILDELINFNTQKKEATKQRYEKSWETRKRKQAEKLATLSSVPSVVTVPAPAPAPAPAPKKLTLKEKNPVFWEAIQRKKHVLTDQLI